jgi:aconitate hydratase
MFRKSYAEVFDGDERWSALEVPTGDRFAWPDSAYVRRPAFFEDLPRQPQPLRDVEGARVLALLGDSVTTDHIPPAGSIKRDGPAGAYLRAHGVEPVDFNSYGSRRGNHEVMVRGTFANIRLRNQLAGRAGSIPEGGVTRLLGGPGEPEEMSIYDAAVRYAEQGTPLVVLGGKEYGSGSSRDWAAKGTLLLGVRAVIAESFERIHRSNLVGMGVLPLQFADGQSAASLGLTGEEIFEITGVAEPLNAGQAPPREVTVRAGDKEFRARVRIDTPKEALYFRHGGILPFVLRQLREG